MTDATKPIPTTLPGGADGAEPQSPQPREHRPPSLDIPELGMTDHRYHSPALITHTVPWHDASCSHLYELRIVRNPSGTEWTSTGLSDGHELFRLSSRSRWNAERCGLAAMRAWLICGHRRTWRKARKEAEA